MGMFGTIILLCWIIFFLYWAINWGNVKPTIEKQQAMARFRWLAFVVAIMFVLFSRKLGVHVSMVPSSLVFQLLGVVLAALGLGIAIVARKTLAGNWSATMDVKKGHELIATGVYKYVRHPIYSGVSLMGVGTFLVFPSSISALAFLSLFISFFIRVKREEKLMTKVFPKEYPAYKKRTKAMIPFVW